MSTQVPSVPYVDQLLQDIRHLAGCLEAPGRYLIDRRPEMPLPNAYRHAYEVGHAPNVVESAGPVSRGHTDQTKDLATSGSKARARRQAAIAARLIRTALEKLHAAEDAIDEALKAGQPKTARGPLLPMPDPLKGDEYREAVESQKRRWGRGDL